MRGSCTLELGLSLSSSPAYLIQTANVHVEGLGEQGTSRDGPVRSVLVLGLAVCLVQDHGPHRVKLGKSKQVDVGDDKIHQIVEVFGTFHTCIDIVPCCHGEEVINIRFQFEQNIS